jgi:hypothetical protein
MIEDPKVRKKKNARDCARLPLGGFRPTLNPVVTNFAMAPARGGRGLAPERRPADALHLPAQSDGGAVRPAWSGRRGAAHLLHR